MKDEMKQESEDPLPPEELTVGIVYNLKSGNQGKTADAEAEYDSIETVKAISRAIESKGFHTVLLEADGNLPMKLQTTHIDIAFNIAEGFRGRGREAQIPALLNMYGIPFTGSDETTLCLALDKALTKQILSMYHVKTPKYQVLSNQKQRLRKLTYPVIVKPNAEGSSKGIGDVSIVESAKELKSLVNRNLDLYEQNMLAEEYIEGREFTVGVLGNGEDTKVFAPMEIIYKKATQGPYHVYSYPVKQEYKKFVQYQCPAKLSGEQERQMKETAFKIYQILECKDFARMDFRMSESGEIYFIEINPLPGLAPNYSDYPMLAEFCRMPYNDLVNNVLGAACKRLHFTVAKG